MASEYNRGLTEVFAASFESLGGEVVVLESYTTDTPDVSEQLVRIRESELNLKPTPLVYIEPERWKASSGEVANGSRGPAEANSSLRRFD